LLGYGSEIRVQKPLLSNGSANTFITRQQICNMQQWLKLEEVFSTRSCDNCVMKRQDCLEWCYLWGPYLGYMYEVSIVIVQKHIREKHLLNASHFGFRARHNTTLQYTRLADHVILNFNNNMSTAAVFLHIEKAFDTTWYPGLLYKLSKLNFSTRIIKLISSFLLQRKFRVSVEGEMSKSRCMQAGVPQGSVTFRAVPHSIQPVY
jgi:hypothetical protein